MLLRYSTNDIPPENTCLGMNSIPFVPERHVNDVEEVEATSTSARPQRKIVNLYISAMSYNILTFTDGAIRMITLFFFIDLGFNAITLAIMFSLYEVAGVFTNLFGGVLGSRNGMRWLLVGSIVMQCLCVIMLCFIGVIFPDYNNKVTRNTTAITVYVVFAQGASGVSKDLMKIQGKSVPKLCLKSGDDDKLFKIIATLTGMKNTLKGLGYAIGSLLVWGIGFVGSLCIQGVFIFSCLPFALYFMENDLGLNKTFKWIDSAIFRKGKNVNVLSAARFFLFGSRDVWFEIALPFFLREVIQWVPYAVGFFLAGYTIIYGQLQVHSQKLYVKDRFFNRLPDKRDVLVWTGAILVEMFVLGIAIFFSYRQLATSGNNESTVIVLIIGIIIFAVLFAIISAVHSYLIVLYSNDDKVSMDLGFYYMANASGRLVGTLISGFIYTYTVVYYGLSVTFWVSAGFLCFAVLISLFLEDSASANLNNDLKPFRSTFMLNSKSNNVSLTDNMTPPKIDENVLIQANSPDSHATNILSKT